MTEVDRAETVKSARVSEGQESFPKDHARRRFMQLIGAGAGVAAFGGVPVLAEAAGSIGFWRRTGNAFVLDPRKTFMNIGTAGSMPRKVLQFFDEANQEQARNSLNGYGSFAALRARIAPGFGVDPDELVVSYNTSDGMCHAILGIPWEPGDCVITTNHEHPGGNVPLQIAVDRYGLQVRRVLLPTGNDQEPEEYAQLFQNAIDAARQDELRVRAMMWSSPTFLTGTMLPIRRLVDVAINNELISICDGAHLPGMMAYNYAELGVDFMAGAGHKWQCGPGSTGILVIRNKVRSAFNPLPLPAYFPVVTSSYAPTIGGVSWTDRATGPEATFDIAAVIQSCGSKHTPMLESLGLACDMWEDIGRKAIQDYILGLGNELKRQIVARWGQAALYSPDHPELVSALTSFNPFSHDPELVKDPAAVAQFVARLNQEYDFIVRSTRTPVRTGSNTTENVFPIRVSTHLWHDMRDIDRFVEACWDLNTRISQGH